MLPKLAIVGGILSAAWHAALRLGYAADRWWPLPLLLLALFVVWIPAVIGAARRSEPRRPRRWLWVFAALCVVYALASSWWLPDAPEIRFRVMASGHLIAFYAVAAAMLWPAARLRAHRD